MVLQREELGNPDGSGSAYPREIVPQQVDDHHVLGPVLLALRQRAAQRGVVHRSQPSWPGSLDRAGLYLPAVLVQPEEALGRGAEHRELPESEIGSKRCGVLPAESSVQVERRLRQSALKPLREVGLEDVAREDVFPHPRYRIEICPDG